MLSHESRVGRTSVGLLLLFFGLTARPAEAWQSYGAQPSFAPAQPSYANRPPIDPRSMPYSAAAEIRPEQMTPYGPVPGPPRQPQPSYRPDDWPSSTVSDQNGSAGPPNQPGTSFIPQAPLLKTSPQLQPINDVQVLATVWSDPILASDVMPYVNDVFAANREQVPPEQHEKLRNVLIRQRVSQLVEAKTLVNDAKRTIPKENLKNVENKVYEVFEKQELPKMMKKANCGSRAELDEKLRTVGSSIDREKYGFFEKTLAQQWLLEKVRPEKDAEITHEEMLAWYRDHLAEYESPPKARWQQLTIRTGRTREKGEAWRMLARLGNMVASGVPFDQVAKQHSEGITAANGGVRDWTNKGSLVSQTLDQALFNLEVGKLSDIIEDEQGFHIIVVLERVDTTRVPFTQAQVEIKEKIKKQRQQESVAKYLAELKKQAPVWTIFDDQEKQKVTERPGPVQR